VALNPTRVFDLIDDDAPDNPRVTHRTDTSDKTDAQPLEHSTWSPVDLTDALNGVNVPPPTILARTDGIHLLYPGRTHGFAGESESLKTWAALVAAQQKLRTKTNVLWIDFEDDARGVIARLISMMVPRDLIETHFTYLHPEEPLRNKAGAWTVGGIALDALLASRVWSLIVIDGVTEAMVTEGFDLNSNADIATWSRLLPKRCANTGAAVVMVDHVPKSTDNRGRYAIGGQHKLAGLTGAQYIFDIEKPFSRAAKEPVTGIVRITVTKDRPGHVRTFTREGVVARLHLTSYPDGGVTAQLCPPDDSTSTTLDMDVANRIVNYLINYPRTSKNALEKELGGNNILLRKTLTSMVAEGWVAVEVRGQSHLHTLTEAGLEAFQ
jgi:hypothetical protein